MIKKLHSWKVESKRTEKKRLSLAHHQLNLQFMDEQTNELKWVDSYGQKKKKYKIA